MIHVVLGTATAAPTLVASIIGAVGAVASAVILGYVALRAQSASTQLDAIEKLIRDGIDDAERRVRAALESRGLSLELREVVREGFEEARRDRRSGDRRRERG